MTRDEARSTLLHQVDALARRRFDDAPLVSEALETLWRPANRDEIMAAVNAGADLAMESLADDYISKDEAYNIANIVACAIGSVLDNPAVTIAEVLAANFADTVEQWREEYGDEIVDAAIALQQAGELRKCGGCGVDIGEYTPNLTRCAACTTEEVTADGNDR